MLRLMTFITGVVTVAGLSFWSVQHVSAQKKDASQEQLVDLSELTLEETLMLPDVPAKQTAYIKNYMNREAHALHKMGYKVETTRKGEVVIASCRRAVRPEFDHPSAFGSRKVESVSALFPHAWQIQGDFGDAFR